MFDTGAREGYIAACVLLVQQHCWCKCWVLDTVKNVKCVNSPHVEVVSLLNKTYRGDVQLLHSSVEKEMPFAEVVLLTAQDVHWGCACEQSITGALSMRCELASCSANRRQDSCSKHDLAREALAILAGAGKRILNCSLEV